MHGLQLNILQNHQASIYPYMQVMCYWSLDLKFKAKLKLERGNRKIQYGRQRPFWKWHCWKSIGFFPYTQVMRRWSLDLIFTAKLKLESGNQKIQDGHQAAILKVTSMKIYRPLPMATNNMHIKFEIEIPKQTWVMLQKSCRLQTDGRTDGQTDRQIDGQGESSITPPHPHSPHPHSPHPPPHPTPHPPFWKWHRWKSIGLCPWPQTICI